jgi:hypothetical protein
MIRAYTYLTFDEFRWDGVHILDALRVLCGERGDGGRAITPKCRKCFQICLLKVSSCRRLRSPEVPEYPLRHQNLNLL